jgi:exodeoxyribonuclease VII small subunit
MAKKNFEKAIEELEKIVQRLENADLPLDEALNLFEEGIKLSRFCSGKLDEAERKVEILLKDEEGSLNQEPFDEQE